jgi:hypothetical protein
MRQVGRDGGILGGSWLASTPERCALGCCRTVAGFAAADTGSLPVSLLAAARVAAARTPSWIVNFFHRSGVQVHLAFAFDGLAETAGAVLQ